MVIAARGLSAGTVLAETTSGPSADGFAAFIRHALPSMEDASGSD